MEKPLVFLSYARLDSAEMEEVYKHLKLSPSIDVWVDRRELAGGCEWDTEIQQAIAKADMALFLITAHFLISDYIRTVEVPELLKRYERDRIRVYPVIAKPCYWQQFDWLHRFNVRPLSAVPIWGEGRTNIDATLTEIAKEVAAQLSNPPEPAAPPPPPDAGRLKSVRVFDVSRTDIAALTAPPVFAVDEKSRLWFSDGEQVKVFRVGQEDFVDRWLLPRRRWKQRLSAVWDERVVYSDWDGAVYACNRERQTIERPLHEAAPGDTPAHLLAKGESGHLAAAHWSGKLQVWAPAGAPLWQKPDAAPYLPTGLLPLADGSLAVSDQANYLRLFDATGRETWSWNAGGPVRAIFAFEESGQTAFVVQVGRNRVARVVAREQRSEDETFAEPIIRLSRRPRSPRGDEWIVVAREGGKIDWLSVAPFRVMSENHLDVGFAVRDLVALRDRDRPNTLVAAGVNSDGHLFTMREHALDVYAEGEPVQRLLADPSGGILFLLRGKRMHVVRNPAVSAAPCAVEVAGVDGVLTLNAYSRLALRLRNVGGATIQDIRAEVSAPNLVDAARLLRPFAGPLPPGGEAVLDFSVCARVTGREVPLQLGVRLTDEAGPPATEAVLQFNVESRAG